VLGLVAFGAGPAADATQAEIAQYFTDHRVATAAQSFLIHGVAAAALAAVLVGVSRASRPGSVARTTGFVGVGLSVVQLVLDLWRSLFAHGDAIPALVGAIDRIDGLKMLAFAVMIGASVRSLRRDELFGRRMAVTATLASGALVVSAAAYGLAIDALRLSAALSLALLLTWVGYVGVASARQFR
jgi:hypothetical protein